MILMAAVVPLIAAGQHYLPTWESIDSRPTPSWFGEAKFGIFIHWGVYSVPAYRPMENGKWDGIYAEWYGPDVMYKPWRNDSFHIKTYGKDFAYRDFAGLFKAELYEPAFWADLIARSGAKYAIFTSKHCDGYAMWPTADPVSKNWNCGETGPRRDLLGDLFAELRKKNLRVGTYYAWLEYENMDSTNWPHAPQLEHERTGYYVPREIFEKNSVGDKTYIEHCHAQFRELVNTYKPDIVWADAAWDRPAEYWRSREIVAWMLNHAPNKSELVINDRWDNSEKRHGGYITTEYGTGAESLESGRPWEECQGMGYSFGFNRLEGPEQYKTSRQLIELLVSTVSRGGNLLLNIGPAADGTIPAIMQERLLQIGKWMDKNGEAIYGTVPFHLPSASENVFYTYKNGSLYVIATAFPAAGLAIDSLRFSGTPAVCLLGSDQPVHFSADTGRMMITAPQLNPDHYQEAYVFRIDQVHND